MKFFMKQKQYHSSTGVERNFEMKSYLGLSHSPPDFLLSNTSTNKTANGKTNTAKLEKLQERALRIIHRDYSSTYDELISSIRIS